MALKILSRTCKIPFSLSLRYFTINDGMKISTAGIIVVGDEILKGEVPDTNSTYLALELYKMGVQLKKISVIGDNVEDVSREVRGFSDSYNYVLTTGGIGPTHDDVTYEGVAKAFDVPLDLNTELRDICLKFYNTTNVNCPGMKMAYIPKSARLNFRAGIEGPKMTYPNVSFKNVYMFPGIPELMKKSFSIVKEMMIDANQKFHSNCVYLNVTEDKIVEILNSLVEEFPDVQFGSYPKLFHKFYKVKVTIQSNSEESMKKAYEKLIMLLPEDVIVNCKDVAD